MSICAPSEYWDKLRIHTAMNRDSIADIMDMDEETKIKKIKLAKKVLKNSDKAFGSLDGRLGEDMYKAIEAYLKMLKTARKAPQIYICDYEKGFGGSPRSIGKEEKIRREKIKCGEINTYTIDQMKSGAEYCMMKLISKDGNIGEITEEQREIITEILEEFYK